MKRIFTHLFVSVLLMLSATSWAQSETNYTVTPSQGSYNKTGWCSSWTSGSSVTYPLTTISVSGGINNMNASTDNAAGGFEFAVGQNSPSTWNFSVMGGYVIESYSFDFVSKTSGSNLTISAAGIESMTSSSSSQTWSVSGVNAQTASFQLSGGNNKIIVTNLKFTVRERQLEEGHVYRFVNRNTGRSLNAYSESVVNAVAPDATSLQQQWYVTKEGDHFVLRNLYYAKYLKGAHVNKVVWSLTDDYSSDANKFTYVKSDTEYNSLETKGWSLYGFMHDDGITYNGGTRVVSWNNENTSKSSHWTTCEVEYTADELQAILDERPTAAEAVAKVSENFISLFKETACYTPKYSSLAEAQATAAYRALTDEMQQLVDKIYDKTYGSGWGEANADATKEAWGAEYAKKFRVQMYEPYSIAGDITSWVGINSHANNDNPTGIYVHEAGTIYVMVEGEIAEGATLRLVDGGSNDRITNAATGGYALTTGLNVINFTGAGGMLYICYNVDTYNPNGTDDATRFPHKLSEYAPLKIHVEGGAINGFYNACGDFLAGKNYDGVTYNSDLWKEITGASVDKDADWEYMESRANLSVLPILGHRQILLFQLNDTEDNEGKLCNGMKTLLPDRVSVPNEPYSSKDSWSKYGMGCDPENGKINILLEAWDRVMYSELATMGLLSKGDMARMNDFYPRWNADGAVSAEIYDYSNASKIDGKTLEQFCGVDYSEVFNHHGVALGTTSGYMYGGGDHCGYNINTFNGVIETFASNAGSTWGPGHEIGHQHQALFTLNGLTEVTNNLFSNIALWYKGMSTSRYNGNEGSLEKVLEAFNTGDVYTNNIWALTHMYYRLWLYYHLAGNNTQFYPRLFELLRHDPMVKAYQQAGDVSMMHFYKLVCQAAGEDLTEFFRAHGYFTVMEDRFVGDYSNSVYNLSQQMIDEAIAEVKAMDYPENLSVIFINDDDETAKYVQHDGQTKREIYGETKPNSDFGSVSDFIAGNIPVETAYTATISADGTVTMSGGAGGVGFLVLNEKGEVVSFSNKSTFALSAEAAYLIVSGKATVVTVDSNSGTKDAIVDVTSTKFALLQELIDNAITLTESVDETRVGFYKQSAVENLEEYVTKAREVIATGDIVNLQAVYELLYAEYNAVVANEFSRVKFVPGSKYAIINKSGYILSVLENGNVTTVASNSDYENTTTNQWYLERDVAFRVKNAWKDAYLQEVTDQNGVRFTVAQPVVDYNITEVEPGWYVLACSKVPGRYMNKDGADNTKVITWGSSNDVNSQWKFILLSEDETNASKEELLEIAKKTLALVDEVATVNYTQGDKIALQSSDETAANYIWSNAPESGNDVDHLLDSDEDTFFHSQWNSSTAPTDGWGHHLTVDLGENPTLTSFKLNFTTRNASNLSNYPETIEVYGSNDKTNYIKLQVASGFATGAGVNNEFVVMGNGTVYRYLRFLVTDATVNNSGKNTGADGMVFFHMSEFSLYPVSVSVIVKDDYVSDVNADDVLNAYKNAEEAKSVCNNASAKVDDINAKKNVLGDGVADGSYTRLLAQYNSVLRSLLTAKKAELKTLIDKTTTLIAQAGTVTSPSSVEIELQVNDPASPYYLLTNSQEGGDNRNISNLLDGVTNNADVYFHTDWRTSVGADHHLLLDMGVGNTLGYFTFKYTTRNNNAGIDAPRTIVVEGSNDNSSFIEIATLTDLPTGQHETYSSSLLGNDVNKYRYVRFRVTNGPGKVGGYYYFAMSEFDVYEMSDMQVDVSNPLVTEELLLNTYFANTKSNNLLENSTSVEIINVAIADLQAAYDALEEAMTRLDMNVPVAGKYYTINNDGYFITSSVTDGRIALNTTEDATAIYYFDGEHLLAYTTGRYFGLNSSDWTFEAVGSTDISAIQFVAAANGATGKFNINSGGRWLHRTDAYVNRCTYNTCGDAHNWVVEEVTSLPVTVTAAGYATFYAPIAVKVPTGVTAYAVTINGGWATLTGIDSGIIPANTGVVLRGEPKTYDFVVTNTTETVESDLTGTAAATYISADAYVLTADDTNEAGVCFGKAIKNQQSNTSWLNNSHKAYLPMSNTDGAASYSFRFGEGTTGVGEVEGESGNVKGEIYDLTGRRVEAVTAPGIYIVGGKKILVK